MRKSATTGRVRRRVLVAVALVCIVALVCVSAALLLYIERQLSQNSEERVVSSTQQIAGNVTDHVMVLQNAIGSFVTQSPYPDDVQVSLAVFKQRFGFSQVAYLSLDHGGIDAEGAPFSAADLPPSLRFAEGDATADEGGQAYSSTYVNGQGQRVRMARQPLYIGSQVVGYLCVEIPFSLFAATYEAGEYQEGGGLLLVDAQTGEVMTVSAGDLALPDQSDVLLSDYLDQASAVEGDDGASPQDVVLALTRPSQRDLDQVQELIDQDETGLVQGLVEGVPSYVAVAPAYHGAWYVVNIVSVEAIRAEAWGVMAAFQLVFAILTACVFFVFLLGLLLNRKQTRERNVRMMTELYSALSKNLDMSVSLYSPKDGVVTPIVKKAQLSMGASMQELMSGTRKSDSLSLSDQARQLIERIRTGAVDDSERGEFPVDDSREGRTRWVAYSLSKLSFEGKDQLMVVFRDITPEKELEFSMRDAMNAANVASQAKSDFLSSMSHEIRTPMNAIVGMNELALLNAHDTQRVQDCLAKSQVASEHLLNLINDVLDLSKIESGKMALTCAPFQLSELVERARAVIAPQCKQKGLRFDVEFCDDGTRFEGDVVRLHQLLANLLTNAVKYTDRGGWVRLRVRSMEGSGQYGLVVIEVADNGMGMSSEFASRLFEPFAMEGRSDAQGTGLGMAIVRNIITLMGGDIRVDTQLDQGSTFAVSVSLKRLDPAEGARCATGDGCACDGTGCSAEAPADRQLGQQQEPCQASCAQRPLSNLAGKRVLLAEDNDLNAEIAGELLREAGLEVEWVEDGAEACRVFEESPEGYFDVVLMDVLMPKMDGYEATRCIRALGRADAQDVPIVALSANAFVDDVNASLESGMNAHVSKPLNIRELLHVIDSLVS